jgi:hypothetical protein
MFTFLFGQKYSLVTIQTNFKQNIIFVNLGNNFRNVLSKNKNQVQFTKLSFILNWFEWGWVEFFVKIKRHTLPDLTLIFCQNKNGSQNLINGLFYLVSHSMKKR